MRILTLLPLLCAAPLAAQSGTLDQSSPFSNASFNLGTNVLTWQAQVRAGTGGTLEGFTLSLRGSAGATVDLGIRLGDAWSANAMLWSGTATMAGTGTWELHFLDCSAAGIALNAGDTFVIEMTGNSGVNAQGEYVAPPGTPPYPEPLYLNSSVHSNGGWRIGFQTWMLSGPPPPVLGIMALCPGNGGVALSNMTPNGVVAIAVSNVAGASVVPSGNCAGAAIGLINPVLKVVAVADANGNYGTTATLPPVACGVFHAQGFDVATCTGTNVVPL